MHEWFFKMTPLTYFNFLLSLTMFLITGQQVFFCQFSLRSTSMNKIFGTQLNSTFRLPYPQILAYWQLIISKRMRIFKVIYRSNHPEVFLGKTCSKNIQQIYQRTPMAKSDSNKVAKQLYWNHTLTWVYSCKSAAYFQKSFHQEHL